MQALAIVIAFFVGLVSGMTLDLPEISDSPVIDNKVEIRRRMD
jgi:hypothetical protein